MTTNNNETRNFTIDFYTIKQYTGRMDFDASVDMCHEVACMLVDESIVAFQARYPNGKLFREYVNHNAQELIKTSPCENSWINTLDSVSPEKAVSYDSFEE
jgi:hypothetical protein